MNTMTEARNLAASRIGAGKLRMTAAAAFVETLAAHRVREAFGVIGANSLDTLDPLRAAGIRLVSVARGQSAAHMADGYARAASQPAVCLAQNGPGLTDFVTAVEAAYWARTPLVMVTYEPETALGGHGGFQETLQTAIFSRITRWQAHVTSPLQVAEVMHRAFTIAVHEHGPVQVSMVGDCLHGEGEYEILAPLAIERAAGGAGSLNAAARMLAAARFPVIVAGESIVAAEEVEAVKALSEYLTAPVVNTYQHNDTFPASHPLACGPLGIHGSKAALRIMSRADVVLALGARLGPVGTLEQSGECWPDNAKIIHIDRDSRALALAQPDSLAIQGDARLAAQELLKQARARSPKKPDRLRLAEVQREKESWAAELAAWPSANRKGQISARRALAQLEKALPRGAIVATDVGNVCAVAGSYLRFEQPAAYLAAMSRSVRGCAYPTALGARMAQPDRPAIAYVGDGAWGMSLAEVMTAVKEKIPAVAVVFNNGQSGADKRVQGELSERRYASAYPANPDFSEMAGVMGAEGYCVEHEDEVADALKAALKSGKPAVVEIMLTRETSEIFGRDAARRARRQPSRQRGPETVG
jgi:sulfoacetaldehyde acetyltransferase